LQKRKRVEGKKKNETGFVWYVREKPMTDGWRREKKKPGKGTKPALKKKKKKLGIRGGGGGGWGR